MNLNIEQITALNLKKQLEEDDETSWIITLNSLVAILMCFIFLLVISLLDQVQRDPFTLQSIVSMWQPSHRFNSHRVEREKWGSRRQMIRKLEGYANTEPDMIFESRLNSVNLPHLGSGLGQLKIMFISIDDNNFFDTKNSNLTEEFRSQISRVVECLASLRKQIDQVKRIEIQVHRDSSSPVSSPRSIFSETAKYAFKIKKIFDQNEEFNKYPDDYIENVDIPHFAKPKTLSDKMVISSYVDVFPKDEIGQQFSTRVAILVSLDMKI